MSSERNKGVSRRDVLKGAGAFVASYIFLPQVTASTTREPNPLDPTPTPEPEEIERKPFILGEPITVPFARKERQFDLADFFDVAESDGGLLPSPFDLVTTRVVDNWTGETHLAFANFRYGQEQQVQRWGEDQDFWARDPRLVMNPDDPRETLLVIEGYFPQNPDAPIYTLSKKRELKLDEAEVIDQPKVDLRSTQKLEEALQFAMENQVDEADEPEDEDAIASTALNAALSTEGAKDVPNIALLSLRSGKNGVRVSNEAFFGSEITGDRFLEPKICFKEGKLIMTAIQGEKSVITRFNPDDITKPEAFWILNRAFGYGSLTPHVVGENLLLTGVDFANWDPELAQSLIKTDVVLPNPRGEAQSSTPESIITLPPSWWFYESDTKLSHDGNILAAASFASISGKTRMMVAFAEYDPKQKEVIREGYIYSSLNLRFPCIQKGHDGALYIALKGEYPSGRWPAGVFLNRISPDGELEYSQYRHIRVMSPKITKPRGQEFSLANVSNDWRSVHVFPVTAVA